MKRITSLTGAAGNDTLCGQTGDATLNGGQGPALFLGGAGDDAMNRIRNATTDVTVFYIGHGEDETIDL